MALELDSMAIGVLLGLLLGMVLLYLFLAGRLDARAERTAQARADRMFEQQRDGLVDQFEETATAKLKEWEATELVQAVEKARQDSLDKQRYVVKGKVGEQMAPLFPEFAERYDPADARFIGSPVDYIIFDNMSQVVEGADLPLEIVLLDVKTGEKAALTTIQRRIRDAVGAKRVRWETMKLSVTGTEEQPGASAAKPGSLKFKMIVEDGKSSFVCPSCGTHVPTSDAKQVANQVVCPECRRPLARSG